MAYADLIDNENIEQNYLAVIEPRRKETSWTLSSGAIYTNSFDYGHVTNVTSDGVALTEASSSALSSGEFYYDFENEVLYVRLAADGDPTNFYMVVTYELFIATFDASSYRVPTDTSTRAVYFEPLITKSPDLKSTAKDILFGYMPVQTFSLSASNETQYFNRHLYDSSFVHCKLDLYHWLDTPIKATNLKKVLSGFINGVKYTDSSVSFSGFDRIDLLDSEYRSAPVGAAGSFFVTSDFAGLDPNQINQPIPYVYGRVESMVPINIDYVEEDPAATPSITTSDNRDYVCIAETSGIGELSRTVPASPSSTTTRTYLDDATGFVVGDTCWIDKASDEYRIINNVDYASNYIEHTALSVAATNGNTVKRGFVSRVDIEQQGKLYTAMYNRDYTIANDISSKGVSGFSFKTSLESNLSMDDTLTVHDKITCHVYGKQNDVTLGGPAFGSDSAKTDSLTDPAVILFDILKSKAGLTESEINTTTFQTLQSGSLGEIGFSIPKTRGASFPKLKDIVIDILQSIITNIYVDDNGLYAVEKLGVLPASADKTLKDDELIEKSFQYDLDYSEIKSDINLSYNRRENDLSAGGGETFRFELFESEEANYLHLTDKTLDYNTLLIFSGDASTLVTQIGRIMEGRRGKISFEVKNRFFDSEINHKIDVTRSRMIGFDYDKKTDRTRSMRVMEVKKGLNKISLVCDDQKGIEDNAGDF